VVVTYRAQLKALPVGYARLLLGLRLAAVAVLAFAMLRPAIQTSARDESRLQLLVLSDASRSMNTADMPGGVSRFRAARTELEKSAALWKEWTERIEVRQFD